MDGIKLGYQDTGFHQRGRFIVILVCLIGIFGASVALGRLGIPGMPGIPEILRRQSDGLDESARGVAFFWRFLFQECPS